MKQDGKLIGAGVYVWTADFAWGMIRIKKKIIKKIKKISKKVLTNRFDCDIIYER